MVDPNVEAPFRKMLGHAMRGELDDLGALIERIGPRMYEYAAALAVVASGYIAVDASRRWPNEVDIRALARHAANTPSTQVTEEEIRDYLSRVVLGSDSPLTVFEGNRAAIIPLFATANLLLSFSGNYPSQWAYLDEIWNSVDDADQARPEALPAMVYRFNRIIQNGSLPPVPPPLRPHAGEGEQGSGAAGLGQEPGAACYRNGPRPPHPSACA